VVGRDGDMRGAALNHAQNGPEYSSHRGDLAAVLIPRGWQGVVVAEQLVRAVHQMDVQGATPSQPYRICDFSINHAGADAFGRGPASMGVRRVVRADIRGVIGRPSCILPERFGL